MKSIKNTLKITLALLFIFIQSCNKDSNKSDDTPDEENTIMVSAACENGFADVYPCNDYDLIARLPLSTFGASAGSDIWGWTDTTTGNEYALFATDTNVCFIDITNPAEPIYIGNLPTETTNNSWRDVKVYNNYAFIVADNVGVHGMQVFDLTRLRNIINTPEIFTADTVYTGVDSCHNIVINETEGYAYLVGCNTFSGGPNFVDITNPLNPVGVGGYATGGYSHDAQVITYNGPDTEHIGKEIYIGSNGSMTSINKVVILDVTDKTNPTFISEVTYSSPGYAHQGWFTEDQKHFILGDELDEQANGGNTRTIIFDFSDLDNPTFLFNYFGPSTAIDHNGYVKEDLYYLANYRAGFRVINISDIENSTFSEIGYFDTYPDNDGTNFNGVWSVYPYFESGNIILSDIERGFFIVRKSGT